MDAALDALKDALKDVLEHTTVSGAAKCVLAFWAGYRALVILYNISPFHPLARFPGPKLAAAGYFYEGYYDWIRGGRYTEQIKRMHAKYGPIVRINPDELHCNDPRFTDDIYAGAGHIRDKWAHQLKTGGAGPVSVTAFSTVPHEVHRMKKAPYARFFSRQQIAKLEGEVLDNAQLVVNKLLRSAGNGDVFDIKEAFNCYTADVIAQYTLGRNMGFITQEGWTPNFATWVKSFLASAYLMRHNALARGAAAYLPFVADYLGEDVKTVTNQMLVVIPGYIRDALADPDNGRLFPEVVQSKNLPDSEKDIYPLSGEAFNFLLAGTETTAAILTVITYELLEKPHIYERLMAELSDTTPSKLKWAQLESKPYFWAIVQETLRIMPGVAHRSARIAREEDLHYKSPQGDFEYIIPKGTPIGMSSVINHTDPELFPEPDEFRPERWLLEDGTTPNRELQKFLIAFSRGTRSCIGENLAYCEIYLMAALLAFQVIPRARLHESSPDQFKHDHEMIVLRTKNGAIRTMVSIE